MCNAMTHQTTFRDLSGDILWEIFRKMPKNELAEELAEIATFCPEFAGIIADTRLWQNVCIQHLRRWTSRVAFEELFTGPCPIDTISFRHCRIEPPISTEIEEVQVNKLDLSLHTIKADTETMRALAMKYACKELILELIYDHTDIDLITAVFSNCENLEALSFRDARWPRYSRHQTMEKILNKYCSNLKVLNLNQTVLRKSELMLMVEKAPRSLEKLGLYNYYMLTDNDLALLAANCPNLKELELADSTFVGYPSLREFNFLESLHIDPLDLRDLTTLHRHLIKLPKLKSVYILLFDWKSGEPPVRPDLRRPNEVEELRSIMEPYNVAVNIECVTVERIDWKTPNWFDFKYSRCKSVYSPRTIR